MPRIYEADGTYRDVEHINFYLLPGPDIFVKSRSKPLCPVPPMTKGNQPTDDGNFIFSEEEAADFAKKLGLALNGDSISVSEKMETNAPGIYSCGNATGGLLQVCKAVYEGGLAGLSAVEYIRNLKKTA